MVPTIVLEVRLIPLKPTQAKQPQHAMPYMSLASVPSPIIVRNDS